MSYGNKILNVSPIFFLFHGLYEVSAAQLLMTPVLAEFKQLIAVEAFHNAVHTAFSL